MRHADGVSRLARDAIRTAITRAMISRGDKEATRGGGQRRAPPSPGKALHTLPGADRAIVFLREMEGLSTGEVATVMGISEDNVKTRLHRARVALQAELEKRER